MTDDRQFRSWRKATASQDKGACVEIANTLGAVRDSKHPNVILRADLRPLLARLRAHS